MPTVGQLNIISVIAISDDNNNIKFDVKASQFIQDIHQVFIHTRDKYAKFIHTPFGNIEGNGYEDHYIPRGLDGCKVELIKSRLVVNAKQVFGVHAFLN